MKSKHFIFLAVLACAVSFFLGFYTGRETKEREINVYDTTIISIIDSSKYIFPQPIFEAPLEVILVPILDTLIINDTIYQKLPLTQNYYAREGEYRAWVSGYRSRLDSIQIFNRTEVRYIENTIFKTQPSKFGVGIIGGVGYSSKITPFVGVGFYYNLWSIK